MEYEHRTD
jgi:hypothetical protein